jgi:hypothetical protein
MRVWRRALLAALVAGLLFGSSPVARADVHASTGSNVQEGDNEGSSDQSGEANSGDAVTGQVVGGVVSGDARVDATNRTENADAESGDAEGSNSARTFVGNNVEAAPSCGPVQEVTTVDCPRSSDEGFIGEGADIEGDISAAIIQEGDNDGSIDQSATADSGDAASGQIIGFVGAGITDIVASNDSVDSDAESGDAEAHNTVDDAEVGNLVTFAGCDTCPPPLQQDILGSITAAVVHEGDNDQSIDQSADATSGDALAGAQVIGAVNSSTGRTSIDATNRSRDADAKSGDSDATNSIGLAASGNAALGVSPTCCGAEADITGEDIDAVIIQEGDNDQSIDQAADASSGDALAGAEVIGSVDNGSSEIVASNDSVDANAESGDADANNSVEDAETGNLVTFAAACTDCFSDSPVDEDISAGSLSAVNIHEGDNDQSIDQLADASSGDALAGTQVIGSVTGPGGDTSIDGTNRSRDADAETGDADAVNSIGLAAVGDAAIDVPPDDGLADIGGDNVRGVNIHEGDNDQSLDQKALATTGDALGGSQVTGVVSGGRTSVVVSNDGMHADVTSGDSTFRNSIEDAETGNLVIFDEECAPCPPPVSSRTKAGETGVILLALAAVVVSRRRRRATVADPLSDVSGDRLV